MKKSLKLIRETEFKIQLKINLMNQNYIQEAILIQITN